MKAVSLLVNSYLPDDLKDYTQVYDAKSINRILYAVALRHPDKFAELEKQIGDIGRNASYLNGETITLKDLEPVIDRKALYDAMDAEIKALPKDRNFTANRREIFQRYNNLIEKETAKAGLEKRNNIAMSVLSGARGKNPQFKAMVSTPGTYSDYKGEPVDVFSRESFADGIRPAMFCASTNGTRASVVSAKCLSEDTLVRMADMSERRIADIRVGDKVLGSDKEGRLFPVEVINVFDNGARDCYKYKFEFSSCHGGSSCSSDVVCTEDHKFLMVSSSEYSRKKSLYSRGNGPKPTWEDLYNKRVLPAGRMHRGARVSVCNPLYPQGGFSGSVDEPWARIIGLLIGDGCLTCGSATLLSCADDTLIDDIREELMGLGHKVIKSKSEGFSWHITGDGYNPLHNNSIVKGVRGFVKGSKCSRNAMLAEYGLLGKYSYEKRLPIGWYKWTAESVCRLLAGLFAADGSVYKTKNTSGRTQVSVDLITTSKHLAEDVRLALSTVCGITPRIENPVYSGGFAGLTKDRVRPIYTLCISRAEDVLKFNDVIGRHIPGVKRGKLARLCGDIVIKQHNPYAKHMFIAKEYVGEVRCFDIEVDHPDHLFVLANGLITSNSSTAKGGDWAKQMASISANQVVRETDCKTGNGISLPIDDSSLKGRALARDTGKYKAGTFITREMVEDLRKSGRDRVVVRSAITCGCRDGLCAHCVGKYFNGGRLPKIGDAVGLVSSTATSEPVCLVEGTMVRMADGTDKAIQDIKPGDMVLGSDLKGFCRPTRVVNVFHNGPRECYRTKVAKTHTTKSRNAEFVYLESTLAHKVLACNAGVGGVRLKDAVPSIRPVGELPKEKHNRLMLQMQSGWNTDSGIHEPMAMLLGMLVGDGSYKGTASGSASVAVKLSCYDDEQAAALRQEIEPMGLLVKEYTVPHEYRIIEDDQYDTSRWTHIDGYGDRDCDKVRNRVRAKLILEGMWGQSCYTKTLPNSIWQWDKESVCKFVGGLIATDGYVSKDVVGYSSNNKALLEDIRKLLESRLGVYSTAIASSTKKRPDGGEYNPTYFFCIGEASSLQALHSQVRIPGRKQALFDRMMESRGPAKSRLAMFRAVGQEYMGTRDTWDIEVDNDTHLFALSNGLIVSNTQMALSAKHTAGMTKDKKTFSGLPVIQQFTQSPEKFKDQAAVSEVDGKVDSVEEAPQGGMYVTVSGKRHYVLPGQDVTVKAGDTVEAGDVLSDGLADAEDIVRLKGLGAGRLYYADRLGKILEDSGAASDRRNIEIIARGAINHVRIGGSEGYGGYLPDDLVDYNALQKTYTPPETSRRVKPSLAVGKYLQEPAMHYTIGTRVTPKVVKDLEGNGYDNVLADDSKPEFEPEMVRLRTASHNDRDWLASQSTSYLTQQIEESAIRGDDTNVESNSDYRPRLAYGKGFGSHVREDGVF